MIGHQVHSNAFAYLPEYSQPDCGFSHQETSEYIYGCYDIRSRTQTMEFFFFTMWEHRTVWTVRFLMCNLTWMRYKSSCYCSYFLPVSARQCTV
jgi:hypothetical protein